MPDENTNPPQPSEQPAQTPQPVPSDSPVTPAATQSATPPPPTPPKPGQPVRKVAVRTKPVRPSGQITTEAGHTPLTEEFDRARWTLPPARMFFIALGIVAVVVAAIAFFGRAKPVASGSINDVGVVQVSDNSMLPVDPVHDVQHNREAALDQGNGGEDQDRPGRVFGYRGLSGGLRTLLPGLPRSAIACRDLQCWLKPRSLRAESSMARSS